MFKGIALLLCLAFVSSSWALHCYECVSEESFEHCDEQRVEVECAEGEHTCGSLSASGGGKTYFGRGCLSDEVHEQIQSSCQQHDLDCNVQTCEEDFCNAGSVEPGSGIEGFRDYLKKRNLWVKI